METKKVQPVYELGDMDPLEFVTSGCDVQVVINGAKLPYTQAVSVKITPHKAPRVLLEVIDLITDKNPGLPDFVFINQLGKNADGMILVEIKSTKSGSVIFSRNLFLESVNFGFGIDDIVSERLYIFTSDHPAYQEAKSSWLINTNLPDDKSAIEYIKSIKDKINKG